MVKSELSVTINVPPEQVFARFSDPMHAMKDIPNVIEVKDITGHGVGMNWKEIYKMAGVHLKIDCTFIDYVVNKRTTIQAKCDTHV